MSKTVYVAIGNSDDKLKQKDWHIFWHDVQYIVKTRSSQIYGVWLSESNAEYQNACWAFEIEDEQIDSAKAALASQAHYWNQDAISWAVAETEFILGVVNETTNKTT